MRLVHHLADRFEIASLQGVADIQDALYLADDVFGAEEVLFGNLLADLIEPDALGVAQELDLGMILADGGRGVLAGSTALVICARGELMLDAGVDEDKFVARRVEREILVLHRLAVQADQAALLPEDGGELVHDAALDTAVIMLRRLADLGEFEFVDAVLEKIIQGKGKRALEGCGRRKPGAEGNVSGKDGVESGHLAAPFDGLAANAEDVAGPCLVRFVFFVETEFDILVIVERIGFYLVCAVDCSDDSLVDRAREDIAAVVVGMFADEVDAAG